MKRTKPSSKAITVKIRGVAYTPDNLPAPEPFASNDSLLETALPMLKSRTTITRISEGDDDFMSMENATRQSEALKEYWHRCFELTPSSVTICGELAKHALSRAELEIVVSLILYQLGLLPHGTDCCEGLLDLLDINGLGSLELIRSLSENGKLASSGLVAFENPQEDLRERELVLNPHFIDLVLEKSEPSAHHWTLNDEKEVYEKLDPLMRHYAKKCDVLGDMERGYANEKEFFKIKLAIRREEKRLANTLRMHPDWKLSQLVGPNENSYLELQDSILVILAAKECIHLEADNGLFKGIGLARAVCSDIQQVQKLLKNLASKSRLITEGLVQAASGAGSHLTDNPGDLAEAEFELSRKCLERLGLSKSIKREKSEVARLLVPRLSMSSLVLNEKTEQALRMVVSQTIHSEKLMTNWGLAEVFPYGRAVTVLFSGPPGTGKTACAEALAKVLGRPLMVADYSRIQNCWVGATEKNIVKVFAEARDNGAVLFWDEADAMFFDRDSASRNWEVRDINVLLQEIESFEGVCILATNRKVVLDKALERRIGLKVEFTLPDRSERLQIWKRLLPPRMPLGPDVDLDKLAEHALSGGQIKILILNAARLAVDGGDCVSMEHFNRALEMEFEGAWSAGLRRNIGFIDPATGKGVSLRCN